ncbi:MAG: hypothetical protein WCL61_02595 [bacterium]
MFYLRLTNNYDKVAHFLISSMMSSTVYAISGSYLAAVLFSLAVGLTKEISDQFMRTNDLKESSLDMLFNVLGIVVGLLVIKIFI